MPTFPGSSFFSDTEFLKKRVFLCSNYDIPLFIYSKFGRPKNFNEQNKLFLRKQLKRYTKIYNRTVEIRIAKEAAVGNDIESLHRRTKKCAKNSFVTQAPNRYQIKGRDLADIIDKQTGNRGPYSCFTGVRDKTSYYGHMVTKVGYIPISKNFYYDLPSEMQRLKHPMNHFVMKIRKGSRASQRTYMRSMLNDLTLCPKDPNMPGPDQYFHENLIMKKNFHKSPKTNKKCRIFHPGAYIPDSERFTSTKPQLPGPGRYNPLPITCPCKCGTEYREDVARLIEYRKWKFSPLHAKYQRVQLHHNTCDAPKIRNIPGKGLTSVFKSNTKRLLDKPKPSTNDSNKKESKNAEELPNMLDPQYIHAMCAPKRETLSLRARGWEPSLSDIKFNTTAKTLPRQKLRTNKAVAFMSSCPRFKGGGGKETFLANRNVLITSDDMTSDIEVNKRMSEITHIGAMDLSRLIKLPKRYELTKPVKIDNDKLGNLFQHLPKPKILLNEMNFVEIK